MILITGASGFVGKNLVNHFSADIIKTISRNDLYSFSSSIIENCDVVIHLAGKAHDLKKAVNAKEYYEINYEITKRVYAEFLKSDAKKFIFLSSIKAVADSSAEILTEDRIPSPETDYGKSKRMAEQFIENQELPLGKSYYILRPCMIHGPGNKGNLNLLYNWVRNGIPYPLASFENKRSFLGIRNLCFIVKGLIDKNVPSGTYHIADDLPLSTKEVVSIFARTLNIKPKFLYIPINIISFCAKIGDVFKLPLNSDRLCKLTESYLVSNLKIKQSLSTSLPFSSIENLTNTVESFMDKASS